MSLRKIAFLKILKMKEKDNGMIDVEVSREAAEATERIRRHIESLPEEKRPKVCIKCITYNHGEFIRETLDGFLMQQTDFPFVAIVHDDASTDNTADIVREYAERYPDIIFPIFETENQYRKPGGPLTKIMQDAIDATGAPYVAMCEGDDYWTSPHKLQLQADFLDTHPDYVMVTHNYSTLIQDNGEIKAGIDYPRKDYDLSTYIECERWIYQPLTIMYRSTAMEIDKLMQYRDRRDLIFIYHILTHGKGHYFNQELGTYRVHQGGVWSGIVSSQLETLTREYKGRRCIYDVEKSAEAACLLIWPIVVLNYSRSFLLKNTKVFRGAVMPYFKHFGIEELSKVLYRRFCLNKFGHEEFAKSVAANVKG